MVIPSPPASLLLASDYAFGTAEEPGHRVAWTPCVTRLLALELFREAVVADRPAAVWCHQDATGLRQIACYPGGLWVAQNEAREAATHDCVTPPRPVA